MRHNERFALKIVGATVVIFILQMLFPLITDNFALIASRAWSEPWMFLSAIFLHADFMHLFFNMFGLALFGSLLEQIIGSKKFLGLYLGTGVFASLVAVWFYPASLGASGALMGVLGALAVMRPKMIIMLNFIPMPMWVAVFVWAALDFIGFFGGTTGIANVAHLAGLFSGLAVGYSMKGKLGIWEKKEKIEVFTPEEFENWHNTHMRKR